MPSVNRAEFVNLLETVQPGLSTRDIFEQSSSFVFQNGWLLTFNGEIACRIRTELPEDFTGAVDAAPLLGVLYKLGEENVELELRGNEMRVSGVRRSSGIRMQAEIALPLENIERPSGWNELPEDFSAAVEIVQETVGTNKDEFITLCIHMHPKYIESCDRWQATRYKIACGHETAFVVRQTALKHVVRFGMHKMAETENWVHFKNKAGLIYSCRRFVEPFPNMKELFTAHGEPVVLPKGAEAAAELAGIFSGEDKDNDKVTVEISGNRMRVRGEGSHGWAREDLEMSGYRGDPVAFRISPALLSLVVKKYSQCEIGADKLRADGEKWAYITALGPVDEKKANGAPEPKAKSRKEPEPAAVPTTVRTRSSHEKRT